MKIVIYTTTMAEIEKLEKELTGLPVKVPTYKSFEEDIKWFYHNDHGILIIDIRIGATGWRAPRNTVILFTGTVRDGPHKLQAMERAGVIYGQ